MKVIKKKITFLLTNISYNGIIFIDIRTSFFNNSGGGYQMIAGWFKSDKDSSRLHYKT